MESNIREVHRKRAVPQRCFKGPTGVFKKVKQEEEWLRGQNV
jgi:hypothetical protein